MRVKPNYKKMQKSAITAKTGANSSVTITSAYNGVLVLLTNIESKIGDAFTLVDGKIKINKAGYYKVSGNICVTGSSSNSTQILAIVKNSTTIATGYQRSSGTNYVDIGLTPKVVYLEVGDVISITLSSNITETYTVAGGNYTYITVEEI